MVDATDTQTQTHDTAGHLSVSVITPQKRVLHEAANMVVMPAHDGQIGVLTGRAPLICKLGSGELRVQHHDTTRHLFVDGGFAEVLNDQVSILTEQAFFAEELDSAAIQNELEAARAMPNDSLDAVQQRQAAIERAERKLQIATRE